jgi:dienelactone hydrolase
LIQAEMLLRLGIFLLIAGSFPLLLSGCTTIHDPYLAAEQIASSHGWQREIVETNRFDLLAYHRLRGAVDELTIYLEGDGNAWHTRYHLSSDPTPRTPLVLELAAQDPSNNLVYLARPCQYVIQDGHGRNCRSEYWSKARFGSEVVNALDEAITRLKAQSEASRIHLVGYSGGGGLAVLIAANRNDIASLRTIAGNLNHIEFTKHHRVSPLTESLNPADFAEAVSMIPQIHFSGEKDRTIPKSIAEGFMARLPEKNCATLVPVKGVSHSKGWQDVWPDLSKMTPPCL